MKLFQRYAFFQTLKVFVVALAAATLGFLFFFIVKTSLDLGAPITLAIQMTPYMLPDLLSKTFPLAALFSVTIFFSQMAGNNEIIALKALGIAPWRVLFPVWIFMFFVSLSSVWLNDLSISWSRQQMTRTLLQKFEETMLSQLRSEKRFASIDGDYIVEVSDVNEDGLLITPIFTAKGGEITGFGETARLEVDYEAALIHIQLYNTEFYAKNFEMQFSKKYVLTLPLRELFRSAYRVDPSAAKIKEALAELAAEREGNRRRLASTAIFAFLRGDLQETSHPVWKERTANEARITDKENRYRLIVPRVWASGFSCFFFAWVGAPFAIWFKKADYTAAFFACFLPILGLYYPLFMFGLEGAKSGAVSPIFAWTGNVALGVVGCYFLKKIH
jgi:lipopolysaccharide export system permease protein